MNTILKKRIISAGLILLISWIYPKVTIAQVVDTSNVAEVDSVALRAKFVQDSLLEAIFRDSVNKVKERLFIDSLKQDSVMRAVKDSLRRDSILKASPNIAVNISAKKRKYVSLPESARFNFVDSAYVESNYYLALEEYFTTTFNQFMGKSLMSVQIGPRNYRTTAFIRSWPIMQAEFEERKEQSFISQAEVSAFKAKQKEYFLKTVDVYLDIKSEFISVTDLKSNLFDITLKSNELSLKPKGVNLLPIYSHVTEYIPWYQRRVVLQFPRFVNGIDVLTERRLTLEILVNQTNIQIPAKYQSRFVFELNPEYKLDPKKVLNELNELNSN